MKINKSALKFIVQLNPYYYKQKRYENHLKQCHCFEEKLLYNDSQYQMEIKANTYIIQVKTDKT